MPGQCLKLLSKAYCPILGWRGWLILALGRLSSPDWPGPPPSTSAQKGAKMGGRSLQALVERMQTSALSHSRAPTWPGWEGGAPFTSWDLDVCAEPAAAAASWSLTLEAASAFGSPCAGASSLFSLLLCFCPLAWGCGGVGNQNEMFLSVPLVLPHSPPNLQAAGGKNLQLPALLRSKFRFSSGHGGAAEAPSGLPCSLTHVKGIWGSKLNPDRFHWYKISIFFKSHQRPRLLTSRNRWSSPRPAPLLWPLRPVLVTVW